MKMGMMLLAEAPMARRMATSLVFSMTTMTSVLMMFSAPTSTIMVKITNMVSFLKLERREKAPVHDLPVLWSRRGIPAAPESALPILSDLVGVFYPDLYAGDLVSEGQKILRLLSGRCRSWRRRISYMPESKDGGDLESLGVRGPAQRGATCPSGEMTVTGFRIGPYPLGQLTPHDDGREIVHLGALQGREGPAS